MLRLASTSVRVTKMSMLIYFGPFLIHELLQNGCHIIVPVWLLFTMPNEMVSSQDWDIL